MEPLDIRGIVENEISNGDGSSPARRVDAGRIDFAVQVLSSSTGVLLPKLGGGIVVFRGEPVQRRDVVVRERILDAPEDIGNRPIVVPTRLFKCLADRPGA